MTDEEKYLNNELLKNARKPEGKLGGKLIDMMNENHESLAQWSVKYLDVCKDDVILDIGCGGGANVERFLKMTENTVYGLDYSDIAVEKSIERNQKEIEDERCEIIQGSVSKMPFNDNSFDIATAFETVYFWPDFVEDLKEVRRVLKDNGIIFISNEAVPIKDNGRQKEFMELLDAKIYSEEELKDSLCRAGFKDIACFNKESTDSFTGDLATWICAIAKK